MCRIKKLKSDDQGTLSQRNEGQCNNPMAIIYSLYVLNLFYRKENAMISPVRKRKLNMARLIDPDKEILCS